MSAGSVSAMTAKATCARIDWLLEEQWMKNIHFYAHTEEMPKFITRLVFLVTNLCNRFRTNTALCATSTFSIGYR